MELVAIIVVVTILSTQVWLFRHITKRIEKIDSVKIASINVNLYDKLTKSFYALESFQKNLETMEQVSKNLENFALRTTKVEEVICQVTENIKFSNRLNYALNKHVLKFEESKDLVKDSIEYSNKEIAKSIYELNINISKSIYELNNNISKSINILNKETAKTIYKLNSNLDGYAHMQQQSLDKFLNKSEESVDGFFKSATESLTKSVVLSLKKVEESSIETLSNTEKMNNKFNEKSEKLVRSTMDLIESLYNDANKLNQQFDERNSMFVRKLEDNYNQFQQEVKDLTGHYKHEFSSSFSGESARIQKLNHLEELPEIKETISKSIKMTTSVFDKLNSKFDIFFEVINNLNSDQNVAEEDNPTEKISQTKKKPFKSSIKNITLPFGKKDKS